MPTSKAQPVDANAVLHSADSPAALIDAKIKALADWRGKRLSRLRALVQAADPEVVEELSTSSPSRRPAWPIWRVRARSMRPASSPWQRPSLAWP